MYMDNQTIKAWQSDRREPCRAYLSPAYTVRLVEADIGMPGLKDAVLFPSGLIDHVAEAESKPHSLSEAWQRSASEKKNEPYFLMAARKVCSIRSMGCCSQCP